MSKKLAASAVGKATARGPVSTLMWGTILWWLLTKQTHVLSAGDTDARIVIDGAAIVLTGTFRMLERRWPWFGVLLLSQERPAYKTELDAITQDQTVGNLDEDELEAH